MYKTQVDFKDVPENAIILDVRNGSEHSEIALKRKHYLLELGHFDAKEFIKNHHLRGEMVYILCHSGNRASIAAQKLEEAGYENVAIIKGGISEVAKDDNTVIVRNKISVERQVRMIAGGLVLIGSLAGLMVCKVWMLLPLFVGCGLFYAGISNSCAMANLLNKMPWNKN